MAAMRTLVLVLVLVLVRVRPRGCWRPGMRGPARGPGEGAPGGGAGPPDPQPLGETLLHAAEAALACGERDGAAERLQRAAPLAARLGAQSLRGQIAILAPRAPVRL